MGRLHNPGARTTTSGGVTYLVASNGTQYPLSSYQSPLIIAQSGSAPSSVGATDGTGEKTLASIVVPGGLMGSHGKLEVHFTWTNNNSANNKTLRLKQGATSLYAVANTTNTLTNTVIRLFNAGAANSNKYGQTTTSTQWGATTGTITTSAIDTAVDFTLTFTGQCANAGAGEQVVLDHYTVLLFRP